MLDKFLQTHWDAARAPVVACVQYQSVPHAQAYRIALARDGVELHAVAAAAAASGLFSRKKKRDALELIPWADVLGAAIVSAGGRGRDPDPAEDDPAAESVEFAIYGCVAKNSGAKRVHNMSPSAGALHKPVSEPAERALCHWTFRCAGADCVKKIRHLVTLVQTLADPRASSKAASGAALTITQPTMGLRRRKYLVYVNPVGGAGKAKQTYASLVAPVFQQSNIECEVVVTQHQAHATEHVQEIPLDTYDCIVAIGGDGLLSELLQGIMKREDWKRAIRQPLGIVPGGSGNGLAATLLTRANEKIHALNAAYALAKGTAHDLDISTVLNSHQEVMYSFLSLEWAFIADVDIESERFRMFGGLRFTISAVAKILSSQQAFAGKIRYLSSENDKEAPLKYHERNHGFDGELAPAFDCFAARPEQTVPHVEGEWKELAGDFHLFWGMNVSHGAADAHVVPGAGIDDGYYYLCCVPAPFSRIELAKLLLGLETGSHVNQKQVQIIRTRAFTLEVNNAADLVVIDGERFKGPKVQVEVHRALGRVMCLPHGGC